MSPKLVLMLGPLISFLRGCYGFDRKTKHRLSAFQTVRSVRKVEFKGRNNEND